MKMLTSEEIRELRLALGYSHTELAFRVGVTEAAVRRWEWGDRRPRRASLILLHQLAEEAKAAAEK